MRLFWQLTWTVSTTFNIQGYCKCDQHAEQQLGALFVRYDVTAAMNMNNITFWEVMQCGLVHSLWNVSDGTVVQSSIPVSNYTASHSTWHYYSLLHLCLLTTNEIPPTILLNFTLVFEQLQIKSWDTRWLYFI